MASGVRSFLIAMAIVVIISGFVKGGLAFYALQQAARSSGQAGSALVAPAPPSLAAPGAAAGTAGYLLNWASWLLLAEWIVAGLAVGAALLGIAKIIDLQARQLAAMSAMGSEIMASRRTEPPTTERRRAS